jgi:hypothetical protein
MKRIIRIEVRFDDGREGDRGPSRETKHAVMAAKAAADAVIRSFPGMKVTETSSSSVIEEASDDCRNPLAGDHEERAPLLGGGGMRHGMGVDVCLRG